MAESEIFWSGITIGWMKKKVGCGGCVPQPTQGWNKGGKKEVLTIVGPPQPVVHDQIIGQRGASEPSCA